MNSFPIPPIVMAGITFYVGIYHLLIYFRQTQHRENLTFALACFTVGCYDVFSAGLYSATSVTEGIRWQRAQIVTLALVGVAFLWFIADYVSHTSRKWVLAFSAYFVLAAIVGAIDQSGLTWSVDQSVIKEIRLSFGLETTYYEVAPGPLTNLQSIMGIGASLYTFWLSARFYRSGRQKEARPLLLAITLFCASVINDTAVSSGLYQFIYLIEYAYMGMVLLMTYSLTDAAVAAAVMKGALQESEEKYRTLFESSSESIILIGLDGAVLDCNEATTKISGLPTEEMIGRAFMELGVLSEEDAPKYAGLFSQAISKGETSSLELKIIHSGNATRWIEVFPSLLKKGGNVYAVQVIISDITKRVRAEEALRESEERFRNLSEAAEEGIAIHDDGVIVEANEALARMFGYELSEMIGMHAEGLATPESWQTILKHTATGYDKPYKGIGVRKDGSTFHCELVGKPYQYRGKTLRVATFRDITERVRAEEMLRRRNRELALLNRVIATATSTLDVEQVLQIACRELAYTFDLPQAAAALLNARRTVATVVAEYLAPGRPSALGNAIPAVGNPATEYVLAHKAPLAVANAQADERMSPVHDLMRERGVLSLLIVPVMERGEVVGTIGLDAIEQREFSDEEITLAQNVAAAAGQALETARLYQELQRHAVELARALEQQQELDRLRSEFIRNVSHELRTPLALVRGHAELLETEVLGELRPEQRESVAVIARRAQALTNMMDDFAAIRDIEMELNHLPVNLAELVHGLLTDSQIRATVKQADLTLLVEIAPDLSPVSGDAIQLRRVVDNLLNNAFKFTPAGGRVVVRLGTEGENQVLEVSDTGDGIPTDQLERVFERFYQIDGSTTRRYGGTGLGLALVKEIVQVHGGQVTVQSIVGQGSTFTVTLPICPAGLSHYT